MKQKKLMRIAVFTLALCILLSLAPLCATVAYAAEANPNAYCYLDFEPEDEISGLPNGWSGFSGKSVFTASTFKFPASENHVFKVSGETTGNASYQFSQTSVSDAILEYKFYRVSGSYPIVYLPTFQNYNNSEGTPITPFISNDGKLHIGSDYTSDVLTDDCWHTVKIQVKLSDKKWNVYLDNTQILQDKVVSGNTTYTTGIFMGVHSAGTVYFDDLTVTSSDKSTTYCTLDFEPSYEGLPNGWSWVNESNQFSASTVVDAESSTNHTMKIALPNKSGGAMAQYQFSTSAVSAAVLEYDFQYTEQITDTKGAIYLPTFKHPSSEQSHIALYLSSDHKLHYHGSNDSWPVLLIPEVGKWYQLKLVADFVNNTCDIYLDGTAVAVGVSMNNFGSTGYIDINAGLAGSGSALVDNLTVRPLASDDKIAELPIDLDFNHETLGKMPEGWKFQTKCDSAVAERNGSAMTVIADPDDANNKIVQMKQDTSIYKDDPTSGSFYTRYYFNATKQAILEYRFKLEDYPDSIYSMLPGFLYSGADAVDDTNSALSMYIRENVNGNATADYRIMSLWYKYSGVWTETDIDLVGNTWYTLKLVLDTEKGYYAVYLDGAEVKLPSDLTIKNQSVNCISFGIHKTQENQSYYLDDIKVTPYVEATSVSFAATNYTLKAGATVTLAPTFVPQGAFCGLVYTSNDTSVATVDSMGVITGIAEGTTTVTVTPSYTGATPITLNITVSGKATGTVSADSIPETIPVGGHLFLNAAVTWDENDHVTDSSLTYASSNSDVITVDEWGELLAVSAGQATVTITSTVNPDAKKEISVTVAEAAVAQTIYVSPNGTGTGDGSSAANTTTLNGALEILKGIDRSSMTGNIEVILADGYYYQADTLALNENHGGNNLYSVVFKAADGADVTIGGGKQIRGSKFTAAEKGLYVLDLSNVGLSNIKTRQLFVDNVRATRARSEGTLKNAELLYENGTAIGIVCDNTELLDYAKPADLELVYSGGYWQQSRIGVSEIRQNANGRVELILDQPAMEYAMVYHAALVFKADRIDYYENAKELIDEPGEWYLDETANKLYYLPRTWEEMNSVTFTIPVLDVWDTDDNGKDTGVGGLLTVVGSDYDHPVQNIRFEGITFADVTWMRPSSTEGHIVQQNNYIRNGQCYGLEDYTTDAAILITRANGITFTGCDFTRIGTAAVKMTGGVQNSFLIGNRFYDISGNAIQIGEPDHTRNKDNYNPTDLRKLLKNCDILNNYIHDIGADFHSAAAIGVGFAANVDICNNEIFNIPYSGMHIGYGWTTRFENVLKNMTISGNFIHDYLQGLSDGGAIYVLGNTGGNNRITDNYALNQGAASAGIYCDNGSSGWIIEGNVCDTSMTLYDRFYNYTIWGTFVNTGAKYIHISNNYYTAELSITDGLKDVTESSNHRNQNPANWPEAAKAIMAASGLQADYTGLRNGQAEIITTNLPTDTIVLSANGTFQICLSATDGKGNSVQLGNRVYYDIVDSEIATVSSNGLVTGKSTGKTLLRIYVVSNDILDVFETELYVADGLKNIALTGYSDAVKLYLFEGSALSLQPYGITEFGREVSLTDVTYTLASTAVAHVTKDGILTPVTEGQTTLTVSGTHNGKNVQTEIPVNVVTLHGTTTYMDDMFKADNQQYWKGSDLSGISSTWSNVDEVSITTALNGRRNYSGCKYKNEMLTFYLGIEAEKDWPSFYFRAQAESEAVGLGSTGYIVCFTDKGMQLQRFNETKRTVIYGTVYGFDPIVAPNIFPYPLQDGELHKIQVGAFNETDGVRLLMYIDGVLYFDYLDTDASAIKDAGYFGLVGTASAEKADRFTLIRMGELVDKTALNAAIVKADSLDLSMYEDGDGKDVFQNALANAKAVAESDTVRQSSVVDALNTLNSAMNALKPISVSKTVLKSTIDAAESIDLSKYQNGAEKDAFVAALAAAKTVYAKENATQTEVDNATTALTEAQDGLKRKSGTGIISTIIAAVSGKGEHPFTDVSSSDWYNDDVQFVYEEGLMDGVSGKEFAPNATVTRAMVATILWRMEGEPAASYGTDFADVDNNQWYSEAIAWTAQNGIFGGYGNGLFGTNDPITREQLATILYRYAKYQGCDMGMSGSLTAFSDGTQVSAYALDAMQWCVGSGLLNGANGQLNPTGTATRAELAAILHRFTTK